MEYAMRANQERMGNRKEAEKIVAKMNDMLQVKTFGSAIRNEKFNELNGRIHALGWLALIKEFKSGFHAQLKLVDPDSEEAQALP